MELVPTIITAGAALIGAFLGSIGRPIAEDKAAEWREKRAAAGEARNRARARVERVIALLADLSHGAPGSGFLATPGWLEANANIRSAVAAVNDQRLTDAVERVRAGGGADAMGDAQWRAGELLREIDEA